MFLGLPDDDAWVDAMLPGMFLYLYNNPTLKIPNEWQPTMTSFKKEMEKHVPGLQLMSHTAYWTLISQPIEMI